MRHSCHMSGLVLVLIAGGCAGTMDDAPREQGTSSTMVKSVVTNTQTKETSVENAEIQASENDGPLTYEVLKGPWHPYEAATGLGLEILIPESATQEKIVALLKQLSAGRDPVSIRVWTSRVAYENEMRNLYGGNYEDLYARHLICIYTKNLTIRGRLYYGYNAIKWIQEKGRFSHLCDQTTPMQ